jgi:hypothetical protein
MANKKPTKSRKRKTTTETGANEPHSPEPSTLSDIAVRRGPPRPAQGTGSAAAGQAGDLQGLARNPDADSQSVEELVQEGQFHEAEVISGIENAPEPDREEVHTHEPPSERNPRGGF